MKATPRPDQCKSVDTEIIEKGNPMKTAEDIIKEKNRDIVTVSPDTMILEALKIMVKNNIGAVLVKKEDQYTGIYTEREFLHNSTNESFDRRFALIRDYMVQDLICARHDAAIHELQDLLLGKCLRHILIKKDNAVIGLVSAGDVTRADLVEHEAQLKSVSWDYYENWKWDKK